MKRLLVGLATAALSVSMMPAADAAPLGITLKHLHPARVVVKVVCPVDPPQTTYVLVDGVYAGGVPTTCNGDGKKQRVVIPISPRLVRGSVHDLSVTVSGDSGEINAEFSDVVVESNGSSLARVKTYRNCAALNRVYKHGVGKRGARDHTTGTPVTSFTRNAAVYRANTARDGDKDGIACEKR